MIREGWENVGWEDEGTKGHKGAIMIIGRGPLIRDRGINQAHFQYGRNDVAI